MVTVTSFLGGRGRRAARAEPRPLGSPGETPSSGFPEAPALSDDRRSAFEEGEVTCLVRAKLDPIREVFAHPFRRHRGRGLGFLMGLPHADGNGRAISDVGEPVPHESWFRPERCEHPVLRLFGDLGKGALEELVVRYPYRLHMCGPSVEVPKRPGRAASRSERRALRMSAHGTREGRWDGS